MSVGHITYEDLHNLLVSLGFTSQSHVPKRTASGMAPRTSLKYHHSETGLVLILPSKEAQRALEGDVASVRMHLVGAGLVDEEELENLLRRSVAVE